MVKFISLFGVLIIFIANFLFTPHVYGANSVYISEINYNGSSVSGGDKWIELYNSTNNPINLVNWKLNMPNSSKSGTVALTGIIPANFPFVIGVKNTKFTNLYSASNLTNYNITNISNTQTNEINYINVQLINETGSIVSQIQKNDNYIRALGVSSKGGIKHSLECDEEAICSLSNEAYSGSSLDFGTPGIPIRPLVKQEPTPVKIIEPAQTQTQVNSEPLSLETNAISALYPAIQENQSIVNVPETNIVISPNVSPILVSQTFSKNVAINLIDSVSFTIPSMSFKPVENLVINKVSIPEVKFQSFSTKSSPALYRSTISPEFQLLLLAVLISYSIISKMKFGILSLVTA